jgi:hypothetical protein
MNTNGHKSKVKSHSDEIPAVPNWQEKKTAAGFRLSDYLIRVNLCPFVVKGFGYVFTEAIQSGGKVTGSAERTGG